MTKPNDIQLDKEKEFIDLIMNSLTTDLVIDHMIGFISDNFNPEDVFSYDHLRKWAESENLHI